MCKHKRSLLFPHVLNEDAVTHLTRFCRFQLRARPERALLSCVLMVPAFAWKRGNPCQKCTPRAHRGSVRLVT